MVMPDIDTGSDPRTALIAALKKIGREDRIPGASAGLDLVEAIEEAATFYKLDVDEMGEVLGLVIAAALNPVGQIAFTISYRQAMGDQFADDAGRKPSGDLL